MFISIRHDGQLIDMYNVYWYQFRALKKLFKESPFVEIRKESEDTYYEYIKQVQQEHQSKIKETGKESSKMYWWEGDSC